MIVKYDDALELQQGLPITRVIKLMALGTGENGATQLPLQSIQIESPDEAIALMRAVQQYVDAQDKIMRPDLYSNFIAWILNASNDKWIANHGPHAPYKD